MADALLWLYGTAAFGSLGLALIELTVLIRLILLPLTVLAERSTARYERLSEEVAVVQAQFKNDPVLANEQIRELLKSRKVNPWAKAVVLAVQLVVLLALYKVFAAGFGGAVDTTFLGFDLAGRSLPWAAAVGVVLYFEIALEQRKFIHLLGKQDAVYRYAFPLFSVVLLSWLPMAKSLFILTSMVFSVLVSTVRHAVWPVQQSDSHD